jgi:hypothetical protein
MLTIFADSLSFKPALAGRQAFKPSNLQTFKSSNLQTLNSFAI